MADLQLIVVDGPNQGTEFDISGSSVIGRDPSSGIVLDDPEASRRHASVSAQGSSITVEDLGSTNGTYVAGERIQGSREVNSGDRIRIGTTVMEVRAQAAAAAFGAQEEDPQATRIGGMAVPDAGPAEPPAPEPPSAAEMPPVEPAPGEPVAFEPAPPSEPPPAFEPPAAPEQPPAPEPPAMPEQPAAFEPPAEPEPADEGATALRPIPSDAGGPPADEGATEIRPVPSAEGPADEGATAMRPVPGDTTQAPPPGGGFEP